MHLVLIETSGNQNYIFATNKLRENVGASELTYRVGTKTVLDAVEQITHKKVYDDDIAILRRNLLDEEKNPPVGTDRNKVEAIVATSGKAILLIDDDETNTLSKQIIRDVTRTAVREMPGLTVHGAISEGFDNLDARGSNNEHSVHKAIGFIHRRLEELRYQMPSNQQRFLRVPFVAQCNTSGLPAQTTDKEGPNIILVSTVSKTKSENKRRGVDRIHKTLKPIKLIDPDNIEKCDWTAVIHADGNGLGQVFLDFDNYTGRDQNGNWSGRQYLNDYRKFSLALDVCTVNATRTSLENLWSFVAKREAEKKGVEQLTKVEVSKLKLPLVPLVLGGDDLTVLCDGQYALKFVYDFLSEFEDEAKKSHDLVGDIVNRIAQKAFVKEYLGVCAGVAIVKPHYPFHQAYDLAEQLLKSAKQVKRIEHQPNGKPLPLPCSAMDFHVLYDSSGVDLGDIRQKLKVDGDETLLYVKPYIVTPKTDLETAGNKDWLAPRTWDNLATRVCAMSAMDDDGKRKLPNSQMHHVRESLHRGKDETDAEMNLFSHRYKDKGFDRLLWKKDDPKSLFFPEKHNKEGVNVNGHTTHFLDALDVVEFWKGFDETENANASSETSANGGAK